MPFDLPDTTTDRPPAFTTVSACDAWLQQQAGETLVQLQATLLRQLNLLNRYVLPPAERLVMMELLRGSVHAVQADNARRFTGKPLPLAESEAAALDTCLTIWNALANGYLHCLVAGAPADQALASQRALVALAAAQFDTCRGGRLLPPGHWRKLHQAFAAAELADVARQEVADEIRLGRNPTTPTAAWVETLLLQSASLHELSLRQMGWVARWILRWSGKLGVYASPPTMSARAIPLCVDLDSDQPAGYRPVFVSGARFLDTSALRSSIKKRLTLLEQGESPKNLQLGDDCTQPQCQQVLNEMYFHWCKGGTIRRHERQAVSGTCTVIGDIAAIHYYLSGRKPFMKPTAALTDTDIRRQREEIATFGRVMSPQMDNFTEQHGYQKEQWNVMEEWHLLDQSSTGLRVIRASAKGGGRFAGGQLVAVQPADAKSLLLGVLRWVLVDATAALQGGIEVIAGKPHPVGIRGTGSNAVADKYSLAFMLPEVPALNEPPSVVMPVGFFRRERVIEVFADSSSQIRLTGIIDRGSDFERATFE